MALVKAETSSRQGQKPSGGVGVLGGTEPAAGSVHEYPAALGTGSGAWSWWLWSGSTEGEKVVCSQEDETSGGTGAQLKRSSAGKQSVVTTEKRSREGAAAGLDLGQLIVRK